jgi:hypothetical protein
MTHTLCAPRVSLMNRAAAGPCTASLPRPRKKWVQPFVVRSGRVADGVTATRPASVSAGPTASDSPENGRPTIPRIVGSLTAAIVGASAVCGEPPVSNSL